MVGVEVAASWVALRSTPGVGDVKGRALLARFGEPQTILHAGAAALAAAGCDAAVVAALRDPRTQAAGIAEVDRIVAAGARVVALDDPEYPARLRELWDAPLYLVARGTPLPEGPAVAIVGARRATDYGCEVARVLAMGLAQAGVAVVSGLARGIDGAAHEGALTGGGSTVAVLGSGIDVIYPVEHRELAERVTVAGTLLSERLVGAAPLPRHFPARNRILAGMTNGTVVVEAAEHSGSLITARLANEAGREVFAVPGRIDSPLSYGAHLLIRDGATLVRSLDDVLEQIVPALRARGAGGAPASSPAATGLLDLLSDGAMGIDELIRRAGRPASEIIAEVLDLELHGVVEQVPGRQVQLKTRFAGVGGFQ
jgi:DNA processing protein